MRGHVSNHAATMAEVLRDEGYTTFAVGKWHLCQMEDASAAGPVRPVAVPARLRPLLRLPRRRDRPVPPGARLRQPRGRAAGATARTATTSARTSSTTRSGSCTTRSRSGPTGRSSCTSRSARRTRRTRRRPRTSRSTAASSTTGWDVARDRWFARQIEMGLLPEGTQLAPRNPGVERVGLAPREPPPPRGAPAGGVRRLPRPHRRPDRPPASTRSSALGELDNTADRAAVRQRREPGGRTVRRHARDEVLQLHPRDPRRGDRPPRRHRRARTATRTTRGAGRRPATRRSSGTSRTRTKAASTSRSSSAGRQEIADADRGGLRDQFHHVNDIAPTIYDVVGVDPARGLPRLRADAGHRHVDALLVRRRRTRRRRSPCSTSR